VDPLDADHNQTISSPAPSLPDIRGAQGRQMQPQVNVDTHRAVSGKCSPFVDLGCCYLPSQGSQGAFLAPKKIIQKNISTRFLFFASLSQQLLQIKVHVPTSLHKTLVFSFCTPRHTHLPVYCHHQTSIQTNRSTMRSSGT